MEAIEFSTYTETRQLGDFDTYDDLLGNFVVRGLGESGDGKVTSYSRPIELVINEIRQVYAESDCPWVVGYSGGKDSTAVVGLVLTALAGIPKKDRTRHVYVICSDTNVELPVIENFVKRTLTEIAQAAENAEIPLTTHILQPSVADSFWVNLIGKGYPAPTNDFRWCTERMKINPSNRFISEKVSRFGKCILVLGSRQEESAARARRIKKHIVSDSLLSPQDGLANTLRYLPISEWTTTDVFNYLGGVAGAVNAWGGSNQELMELYRDSNAGECPLVIDKSTPSCGHSRFGCWVCTVVQKDKAVESLIEAGETQLIPLKEFRNQLYKTTDPAVKGEYRNERRRDGQRHEFQDKEGVTRVIHGPYKLEYRKQLLKELLEMERDLVTKGEVESLITHEELLRIRKEWRHDPLEPNWSDDLPAIYEHVYSKPLKWAVDDTALFGINEERLIRDVSAKHGLDPEMVKRLIDLELSMDGLSKRLGIFNKIGEILSQTWDDEFSSDELTVKREMRDPQSSSSVGGQRA